jgi:hypothetical protein
LCTIHNENIKFIYVPPVTLNVNNFQYLAHTIYHTSMVTSPKDMECTHFTVGFTLVHAALTEKVTEYEIRIGK